MKTSTMVWTVVVVIVAAGLGWYFLVPSAAPVTEITQTPPPQGTTSGEVVNETPPPMSVAVTYGSEGFSPQEVTIKKGGSVTWTNNTAGNMWVASAQHPTHTTYSGTSLQQHCDDATDTSFDQCENSSNYTFTFDKAGTWGYHNHANSSHFGRVIVVE